MKKVKVTLSIDTMNDRTAVIEVDDHATEGEIDKAAQGWADNYVSIWWQEQDED